MKRNIIANTFTPSYDELEDRLRLVINYQDMQNRVEFMITRSFVLNLIPTAEEFIERNYMHVEPQIIQQAENKNQAISKTDNVNLELLRTNEELLTEVTFSFDINTKLTIVTFNSKNSAAQANLDAVLLSQIFQIIKSSIPYIKWGISSHF
ncbi:MAG: hypothetical protein NTW78_10750 [Campylobacterales bacterium]|nr:hypothetical protein [Campylobacterales bacterium]